METNAHDSIDLVYLWVDGNDPVWKKKHDAFVGQTTEESPLNCKGRYVNNDELKYSLRSVSLYAPWIRQIFIVTDNQVPSWLDTSNPKIKIIDHTEILPPESLPCFNSSLIEHFLYKIPGLTERFLFSNDDMYLNKPVRPEDFFTPEGLPIVRLTRKPFRKIRWFIRENIRRRPLKNYRRMVDHSTRLVEKMYGIYYNGLPHHNIDAYLKSDYRKGVEETLHDEFQANNTNHMRSNNDIHRSVLSYIALAENRAVRRYVDKKESFYVNIQIERDYKTLQDVQPTFFCMNDSEKVNDKDRKRAKEFLEQRFPQKSEFEK